VRFVHVLTAPESSLRAPLRQIGAALDLPYNHTPYFLTVKPLDEHCAQLLFGL